MLGKHGKPDAILVEGIRSGREDGSRELLHRYVGLVRTCIWNLIRDRNLLEDLAQEIFSKAFARLDSLKDPQRFKVWLLRIAHCHCVDFLRRKKPQEVDLEALEATGRFPQLAVSFKPIEDSMMVNMLEYISPEDAELLWLRFAEEISYVELTVITGMNEVALRKRVSRGLRRLREMMT